MIGVGIPMTIFGVWGVIADYGTFGVLLVIPLTFLGAYVWGLIMWRILFRDIRVRLRRSMDKDRGQTGIDHE
jgi:hypothetical protein